MKKLKSLPLAAKIFLGLALGIVAGVCFLPAPQLAVDYIKPFGTIFLNLIQFIVVPIVFFSIICGVISMKDIKKVGSVGVKTLIYYACTTAIAIAQKMESAGLCTAEEFLKEANEGDFSAYTFWQYVPEDKEAPNRFMKCEGYLFPETYEFLKDDTVHNYVATFYAQFDAQFTKEMYAALKKQGMTLPELVTLASFVQEEAGNSQDSNVAQVFRM